MYNRELIEEIGHLLIVNKHSISLAESVTSGHLQAAFSLATNASKFLQGGMTVFNIGQKVKHLNVEPIQASVDNCVNQFVAETMATEIQKKFISSYGLGITGYASWMPEIVNEPLYAYIAISYNTNIVFKQKLTSLKNNYLDVQIDYVHQTLDIFLKILLQKFA